MLLNDIDLTELTEWTPIGQGKATGSPSYNTLTNPFTGVFDGQGFTIKGIRWTFNVENETTHLHGLFGAIKDATIKNLKLGAAGDQITLAGTSQNVVSAGSPVSPDASSPRPSAAKRKTTPSSTTAM